MRIDPVNFGSQLDELAADIRKRKSVHVNAADEISRIRAVVAAWFNDMRMFVDTQGTVSALTLDTIDKALRELLSLTLTRSIRSRYSSVLKRVCKIYKQDLVLPMSTAIASNPIFDDYSKGVEQKLNRLSPQLSLSYRQVALDLADDARLSYKGTANELREILRVVLSTLAPDADVRKNSWYRPEGGTGKEDRPTHRHRAKHILQNRRLLGAVDSVQHTITAVEDGVAQIARDLYERASSAVHTDSERSELRSLIRHINTILSDLCD